jgi:hypothetical protein
MSAPHCHKHPHVKLICPACAGAATSEAKAKSSAANGRLGGRPKLPKHTCNPALRKQQITRGCPRCDYDVRARIGRRRGTRTVAWARRRL